LYLSQISLGRSKKGVRWAGHVSGIGAERNVYNFLVGNPEVKKPLGRPGCRWEDGIRMDLREIFWGCGMVSVGS
jgi:hypothetical protein